MTEGVQDNILSEDIVPQPVVAPSGAPLSFPRPQPREFLDVVLPAAVVRVLLKNNQELRERFGD